MASSNAFAQHVAEAVTTALDASPEGVRFADVAELMGPDFGAGGPKERRLRRALDRLRSAGVLASPARGVFVQGRESLDVLGVGVATVAALERFFAEHGGMARAEELRAALGVGDDDAARRALFRALDAGRYENPPRLTHSTWWILPEEERLATVLPGWRIEADTSLALLRSNGFWREPNFALNHQRRRDIGRGVERARERAGVEIEELLAGEVGDAFASALERTPGFVFSLRFPDWWRRRIEAVGADAAAEFAWCALEAGERTHAAFVGDALNSRFWRMLAARLDTDPVRLSRGFSTLAGA